MRILGPLFTFVLAGGILVGCADEGPTSSLLQETEEAMSLQSAAPGAAAQSPAMHSSSDIYTWPAPGELVEGGMATLLRTDRGIRLTWKSPVDDPGAYTVWWVIWNNPDECEHGGDPDPDAQCGLLDLFMDGDPEQGPNPAVSVMSGGGHIVGKSLKANFGSTLREGEITSLHPGFPDSPGLLDARNAEVHVVLQDHGELVPSEMPDQIKVFQGGCDASERDCSDVQFAVFK